LTWNVKGPIGSQGATLSIREVSALIGEAKRELTLTPNHMIMTKIKKSSNMTLHKLGVEKCVQLHHSIFCPTSPRVLSR